MNSICATRQKAIDLITQMSEEQAALALRILNHGDACIDAVIHSGIKGYEAVLQFIDEWEAKTA